MSNLKLSDREWKTFNLGDIFMIENCKCSKVSGISEGKIPYVGATNRNNGTISFIEERKDLLTKGNCMVFICDGEGSIGYSIYKKEDFIGTTTIKVGRNPNLNRYIGLFLTAVSDKVRGKYNFGYKRNEKNLKREKILLPTDQNGNIDWQFMEDFMRKIEQDKVKTILEYYKNMTKCQWEGGGES